MPRKRYEPQIVKCTNPECNNGQILFWTEDENDIEYTETCTACEGHGTIQQEFEPEFEHEND